MPTGSETITNTIGIVRDCRSSAAVIGVVCARITSGTIPTSCRVGLHAIGVGRGKPNVEPNIMPFSPPQLLQPSLECRDAMLCHQVALCVAHEHADAPHLAGLLRPRRERPRGSRAAAEQRDELAPSHVDFALPLIA